MYPELVIICDEIRIHIKNGKLLTITIGDTQPFDYQQIANFYKNFIEAVAYEDQVWYYDEWCKSSNEFKKILSKFKCYNDENGENPLLNSICCALTNESVDELLSHLGKDFFKT